MKNYYSFFISCSRRVGSALAIAMALTTAVGQVQGGGAGNGGGGLTSWWGGVPFDPGGTWHAEAFYQGKDTLNCWMKDPMGIDTLYVYARDWSTGATTKNGQPLSPGEAFPGSAANTTGNSRAVTAESKGEVTIKLQWTGGPLQPPSYIDLVLNGQVTYAYSDGGTGSGDTGIGIIPTYEHTLGSATYGTVAGKKIRRFRVALDGTVTFSYSPEASSFASGVGSGCDADAQWHDATYTLRSTSLASTSHPGGSTKKLTGNQLEIVHWEYNLPEPLRFHYAEAVPGPNPIAYTPLGSVFICDVGFPTGSYPAGSNTNFWLSTSVDYQGAVISPGGMSGNFWYTPGPSGFYNSPNGTIASQSNEVLNPVMTYQTNPLGQIWAIIWGNEDLIRDYYHTMLYPRSMGIEFMQSFGYTWDSDGAESESYIIMTYHYQAEKASTIGTYDEVREPDSPVPLPSPVSRVQYTFSMVPFADNSIWAGSNVPSKAAKFYPLGTNAYVGSKVAKDALKYGRTIFGFLDTPKIAAIAASLLPDLIDDPDYSAEDGNLIREVRWFKKAYNYGLIEPSILQMPGTDSAVQDLMELYQWKELRRTLYKVTYYETDNFNESGYTGQTVSHEEDPYFYDIRQSFQRDPNQGGGA